MLDPAVTSPSLSLRWLCFQNNLLRLSVKTHFVQWTISKSVVLLEITVKTLPLPQELLSRENIPPLHKNTKSDTFTKGNFTFEISKRLFLEMSIKESYEFWLQNSPWFTLRITLILQSIWTAKNKTKQKKIKKAKLNNKQEIPHLIWFVTHLWWLWMYFSAQFLYKGDKNSGWQRTASENASWGCFLARNWTSLFLSCHLDHEAWKCIYLRARLYAQLGCSQLSVTE